MRVRGLHTGRGGAISLKHCETRVQRGRWMMLQFLLRPAVSKAFCT